MSVHINHRKNQVHRNQNINDLLRAFLVEISLISRPRFDIVQQLRKPSIFRDVSMQSLSLEIFAKQTSTDS